MKEWIKDILCIIPLVREYRRFKRNYFECASFGKFVRYYFTPQLYIGQHIRIPLYVATLWLENVPVLGIARDATYKAEVRFLSEIMWKLLLIVWSSAGIMDY